MKEKIKIIAVILLSVLVLLMCTYYGFEEGKNKNYNCLTPSKEVVRNFCNTQGYEYGWLDADCGENHVRCSKTIGTAKYFDCLELKAR